jgi:hypothetical protein
LAIAESGFILTTVWASWAPATFIGQAVGWYAPDQGADDSIVQ